MAHFRPLSPYLECGKKGEFRNCFADKAKLHFKRGLRNRVFLQFRQLKIVSFDRFHYSDLKLFTMFKPITHSVNEVSMFDKKPPTYWDQHRNSFFIRVMLVRHCVCAHDKLIIGRPLPRWRLSKGAIYESVKLWKHGGRQKKGSKTPGTCPSCQDEGGMFR